jgi:hypothetical protein
MDVTGVAPRGTSSFLLNVEAGKFRYLPRIISLFLIDRSDLFRDCYFVLLRIHNVCKLEHLI